LEERNKVLEESNKVLEESNKALEKQAKYLSEEYSKLQDSKIIIAVDSDYRYGDARDFTKHASQHEKEGLSRALAHK
jgi:hypothetical protein